jgi:hypothetical protein
MRIPFVGRAQVVQQVQRALGLADDGDDRRATWQAIVSQLPLSPVPLIIESRSVSFPGRDSITMRVQRHLGVHVDGHDGQETWSALAERFDPRLLVPVAAVSPQRYPERVRGRTPNRNSGTNACEGLVLHHAAGWFEGTVSWCLKPGTFAGYHCIINTDGERAILAHDSDRCHHAGASTWRSRSGCNAFMLGLCFIGNTNDGTMRGSHGPDLTAHEIASALEWIRPRMAKYGWTADDITRHAIVSPGRKDDTSLRAHQQILAALNS